MSQERECRQNELKEKEFCFEAGDFEFVISGKSRWEYLIVTIRNGKFEFRKGF